MSAGQGKKDQIFVVRFNLLWFLLLSLKYIDLPFSNQSYCIRYTTYIHTKVGKFEREGIVTTISGITTDLSWVFVECLWKEVVNAGPVFLAVAKIAVLHFSYVR
jgi:hypothetical protein